MKIRHAILVLTALVALGVPVLAQSANPEVRIKDIAHVQGVSRNALVGYGLVVGLANTGDTSVGVGMTSEALSNALERLGTMKLAAEQVRARNVASVIVTASMAPYAKSGDALDINVSSVGDARSLQGGTLVMCQLKAADGKVYALAQGQLSIGGLNQSFGGQNNNLANHELVGRIPEGATLVRDLPASAMDEGSGLTITLNQADATTASKMAQVIRDSGLTAEAVNPSTIRVEIPPPSVFPGNRVDLVARIEQLGLRPDHIAKVVINERTGTVVMGGDVRLGPVAIAHGNLRLVIQQTPAAAYGARGGYPGASSPTYSYGPTAPVLGTNNAGVTGYGGVGASTAQRKSYSVMSMPAGTTLRDVTDALNTIGVTPRDLIAIVQALKQAGALDAELQMQ